jgi:hypothetical protein
MSPPTLTVEWHYSGEFIRVGELGDAADIIEGGLRELRPIARADVTAAALTGAYELKASLVAARAGDAVATWERRMMNPWRREPRCPTGVSLHVPTAACCDGGVGQRIGSLIGAVGGLVFILINAGALGQPASSAIRLSGTVISRVCCGTRSSAPVAGHLGRGRRLPPSGSTGCQSSGR